MKRKFLGLMIAAGMLFAISCTQNEGAADPGTGSNEEVTVTFSIATEDAMAKTRVENISDGTDTDMLIYAVYSDDASEATGYRLLEYYGSEEVIDPNKTFTREITPGKGQTVMATDQLLEPEGQQITLRLMRGKTYHFAFWAQNHRCEAYDTADLEQVEVKYTTPTGDALNNDELRDAFSASYSFVVQPNMEVKVVLIRALAQINVGTSGWDYNDEVEYGYNYAYSRIELDGVYRFINVLKDEIVTEVSDLKNKEGIESVTTNVVYDWNRLPAYLNTTVPTTPEELRKTQENEQFLRVKLTSSDQWLGYLTTEPDDETTNTDGIYTEVFKYLSMCYALIPAHNDENDKDDFENKKFATPIDEVRFYMAETPDGKLVLDDPDEDDSGMQIFALNNVPAQRNWRTNILGGAGKGNSLFNPRKVRMIVNINPGFENDYNTDHTSGEWVEWSNE